MNVSDNETAMAYRAISDDELISIITGARIRKAEPINSPNTDGWILLLDTCDHGRVSIQLDDLLGNAADPDDLSRIIAARISVLAPGKQSISYMVP